MTFKLAVGWGGTETNVACNEGFTGISVTEVNNLFHDLDETLARELAVGAMTSIVPWRGLGGLKSFVTRWITDGNLYYGYNTTDSNFFSVDGAGQPTNLSWGALASTLDGRWLRAGECVFWNSVTTNSVDCARYRTSSLGSGGVFTNGTTDATKAYREWWYDPAGGGRYYRMNQAGEIQTATTLTGAYSQLASTTAKLVPIFDPLTSQLVVVGTDPASGAIEVYSGTTLVGSLSTIGVSGVIRTAGLVNGRLYLMVSNAGNTSWQIYRSGYGTYTTGPYTDVTGVISGASSGQAVANSIRGSYRLITLRNSTDDYCYFSVDDGASWAKFYASGMTGVPKSDGSVRLFYARGMSVEI